MSYAQFGTIQASDFNTFVGGNPTTTANTLNATWSTGGSSAGYGQAAVANVAAGQTVVATSYWNALVSNTASAATHQGTSISTVTAPTSGGVITYLSSIPTNLSSIYSNRLNAASQGSTTSNTQTYGSSWSNSLTFTFTAGFANGDAARYFFNSGGQLKVTCSSPTGTGINLLLNNLASNVGTVVLSAPSSGTVKVVGTTYNGITKIGGGGNSPTISTNSGYYGLTTTNTTVFTQTASTGPSGYLNTNISVVAKTNGTVGTHADNGNVITVYVTWNEVPSGLSVNSGSATTLTIVPPETTNLANSWGTITLTGANIGS
jgi:hypothetical protein